ncbi:hypothetical protein JM79_2353 [Gramella sp. Hel_I_59]|uniref:hypothetical protein n=1 Tax=Gramella sp. Hel_I_59 TaxID=1249978 RepID=UPI0011536C90|nr:hypothetical protein [Gramella sp. Hel_I_59]TQI71420.1 hypothetical protein JM79_2353 [Gramella sp. Hel_I_59]
MELNKLKENLRISREQREINYWSENYDRAHFRIQDSPIITKKIIAENKLHIKQLTEQYPFYQDFLDLIRKHHNESILKLNIVQLIISYLEFIYDNGNVRVKRGNLEGIAKKDYAIEKSKILKDMEMMLYQAILSNRIRDKIVHDEVKLSSLDGEKENDFFKKPGRKPYSELAVIALKYHIINKFDKNENPHSDTSRFARVQDFYDYTASKENLNSGSFSNKYKEIGREKDLEKYCKSNTNVVQALIKLNCFRDNEECYQYLSQFDTTSE